MEIFKKAKEKFQALREKASAKVTATVAAALVVVGGASALQPTEAGAAPIDFSTQTGVDIAPADVISTGFSFFKMFDTYTMLVLGILFAPVAATLLFWIWSKLPKGKKS